MVMPPVIAAADAIEPTERSIVPDMMRKAAGMAMIPSSVACIRMLCPFAKLKKLGRRIEKTAMSTIRARKIPFFAMKIFTRSAFMSG